MSQMEPKTSKCRLQLKKALKWEPRLYALTGEHLLWDKGSVPLSEIVALTPTVAQAPSKLLIGGEFVFVGGFVFSSSSSSSSSFSSSLSPLFSVFSRLFSSPSLVSLSSRFSLCSLFLLVLTGPLQATPLASSTCRARATRTRCLCCVPAPKARRTCSSSICSTT